MIRHHCSLYVKHAMCEIKPAMCCVKPVMWTFKHFNVKQILLCYTCNGHLSFPPIHIII